MLDRHKKKQTSFFENTLGVQKMQKKYTPQTCLDCLIVDELDVAGLCKYCREPSNVKQEDWNG